MVQVNVRLSDVAAQKLKDLAAQSGLALGVLLEKMMDCYQPASTALSPASAPASIDAISRLSGVVADLEARMSAMEARLSAIEPVLLAGKVEVAGRAEDAPDQSGSRENAAQKRSLHGTPDDQFDELVLRYRVATMALTGRAMRDAGYSFPQKRLVESWARLKV